jgi:hypothetical protein
VRPSLEFVVDVLVELAQLSDAVGGTVLEVLIAFGLLVTFAVDFQERLVVGLDDTDCEIVAFGALGMERTSAVLVVAGHSHPQHVPAD